MDTALLISMSVNSEAVTRSVEPRQSLADFIRNELELTGTHVGCEHGVCGACTVRLDGQIVRGCLTLAVQADGCSVETIEGLTQSGEIADLQDAFVTRNAKKIYRVQVDRFNNKEDALILAQKIQTKEKLKNFVTRFFRV